MGVRLYTPALGRFLTTDPVYGGNATTYGYPTDPINQYDLDGLMYASIGVLSGGNDFGGSAVAAATVVAGYFAAQGAASWRRNHRSDSSSSGDHSWADPHARSRGHHFSKEHTKNTRQSNKAKHEKGQGRKGKDKPGGEKGDKRRPYQR